MWPFNRKKNSLNGSYAGAPDEDRGAQAEYGEVVARTAAMTGDREARSLASRHGLQILNVTWEDTGRFKGSAVGPNISDVTLQVETPVYNRRARTRTLMPVIRFPNFSDKTGDVPLDRFFLRVGNEHGGALTRVSLREYLGNLRRYLHRPSSWTAPRASLLAPRDEHALASAQACFLPIPRSGGAAFNPVIFNYQSRAGDPAVLAILATREGTSATVIDNVRDRVPGGPMWGQQLFFNKDGERAGFTGQRLTDFRADAEARGDHATAAQAQPGAGLNMVLLIQVPLKQRTPTPRYEMALASAAPAPQCMPSPVKRRRGMFERSDVEEAVIGHGEVEGPFTELADLPIERDPRFPIRVTVQFYKATSNGVVSAEDMAEIASQIDRVYRDADFVGSLVTEGETGRPTEHSGPKDEPPGWWEDFWRRHEANTGERREVALARLRALNGGADPDSADEARSLLQRIGW